MRSSKDLAKRLRFDPFPRRDFFRRYYLVAGIGAVLLGLGTWLGFTRGFGARQYLPGPLSQSHASFGDRCERCHQAFTSVQNTACLQCHTTRRHSTIEVRTPRCATCHAEHRGIPALLSVSNQACEGCHATLETTSPTVFQHVIRTFADHPEFTPLRPVRIDGAALRFNHYIHLTSDEVARTERLQCASCHVVADNGQLMQPISFNAHCKRCHEQKVAGPIGSVEALHTTPEKVRVDLVAQLLGVAVQKPDEIFGTPAFALPGKYRGPIDESGSLRQYQQKWLGQMEEALYQPFDPTRPLLQHNKYCFLCHVQAVERAPGELAVLEPTAIPRRWLAHGEFSHRRHDQSRCQDCHDRIESSELTSDINLPSRDMCRRCHVDGVVQSAGTRCTECHLYHDVSKVPALRAMRQRQGPLDFVPASGSDLTAIMPAQPDSLDTLRRPD